MINPSLFFELCIIFNYDVHNRIREELMHLTAYRFEVTLLEYCDEQGDFHS